MKRTNQSQDALPAADGVLEEFDRLRATLAETHVQIPALLARQRDRERAAGLTETEDLRRQLADVVAERQSAARRRSASIAAIMELEPALQAERAALERQRQEYASEAVRAFQERYRAAVAALQALWAEGEVLGAALRTKVPMALPVTVVVSPVDGVARAQPILAQSAPKKTIDSEAARLGAALDRLDEGLSLIGAIRQAGEWEAKHHALAIIRGTASEHTGVYRVMLPFRCQVDSLEFQPGELVDSTLVGSGMLHRLMTGRHFVAPVGVEA